MRLHAYRDLSLHPGDTVVHGSRWGVLAGLLICIGFATAGVWMWNTPRGPGPWFSGAFVAMGALGLLQALRLARLAAAGHDWQIRYDARRMLIKLGATHWRNAPAIELPLRDIAWVRRYEETTIANAGDERRTTHHAWLEIDAPSADRDAIRNEIRNQQERKWRGWTVYHQVPVSVSPAGQIRIAFRGPFGSLRPGLATILDDLARHIEQRPAITEHNDLTLTTADKTKIEQQILELAERGQILPAIRLTRQRYGLSLKEAKSFVEGLRN